MLRLKVTDVLGKESEPICRYYRCKHKFSEHGTNLCRCKHPQNTIIGVKDFLESQSWKMLTIFSRHVGVCESWTAERDPK